MGPMALCFEKIYATPKSIQMDKMSKERNHEMINLLKSIDRGTFSYRRQFGVAIRK